jgi:hypothetical protein
MQSAAVADPTRNTYHQPSVDTVAFPSSLVHYANLLVANGKAADSDGFKGDSAR